MALTDEGNGGMVMPVTPMYGGGYGNGGFGGFGGDGWWIILLFVLLGGFGNGWGGNGGYGGGGNTLYPWMNQAEITTDGFRDQMLNSNITSIRDGISDISTQLCNGFAGIEQGANARQIANMQQAFAAQTAMSQGFNSLGAQFADCCCENRLGLANLGADIAREACADRAAVSNGIRDILAAQSAGIQSIKDQLCQDKIDAKNDLIAQLRQEVLFARGQASQDVQTARILAGQTAEVDALYNRLDQCPVGTTPVYGRTPIFTCNNGCGCGNNF